MSESLLIICEKPSAAENFKKALGGPSGEFEGDRYVIVNLVGHILENPVPEKTATKEYQETVGGFSNVKGLPWQPHYFDFNHKVLNKPDYGTITNQIQHYLDQGYLPVVATDCDKTGEGDVIAHEVLNFLNYKGKRYREYHVDETPKGITTALRQKKVVPTENGKVIDPVYLAGFTRSNADFMTQSMTRMATIKVQSDGVILPKGGTVPFGRVRSVALVFIGDQHKAIAEYKPSSVWESRYQLDNLILKSADAPSFKTKEEWQPLHLPEFADVEKVKEVNGTTAPPKPLNLSSLTGEMTVKGHNMDAVTQITQKLYEAGIISYPRTEETHLTTEQFNEILPKVDTLLSILNLPSALFTHRSPRKTHVKDSGAHGALHPGVNIPESLSILDAKFGKGAAEIYKLITERFLMMFLEDTEWVRHEYQTVGIDPVFTGSIKIITKQGVTNPDEETDEMVATTLPDLSKQAKLYPHEVKTTKPANPTAKWVLKQMEKNGVGTPATQVSTLTDLTGKTDKYPIKDGKVLTLNPIGQLGYIAANGTIIGSIEGTRKMEDLMKQVGESNLNPDKALQSFASLIAKDVEVLRTKDYQIDKLDFPKRAPRITGIWQDKKISLPNEVAGHTITPEEWQRLLKGEEFEVTFLNKDHQPYKRLLSIQERTLDDGRIIPSYRMKKSGISGMWDGKEVTLNPVFMGHTFTESELKELFAGNLIRIDAQSNSGTSYKDLEVKLGIREFNGHKFVGVIPNFTKDPNTYFTGTWKNKPCSMKKTIMGRTFTPEEFEMLCQGGEIQFEGTTQKGKKMTVSISIGPNTYNGKSYIGAILDFGNKKK